MAHIDEAAYPDRARYVAALREIAYQQWHITFCFCASVFLSPVGFIFTPFAIRLMRAMRFSRSQVIAMSIAMFMPIVNVIIIGVLNVKACAVLRRAGLHVGFFGVNPREFQKLE